MNNQRNNNRRRGRGNRPQQQGGNQSNRIDSRARGNAPQLLDKYKKLAQDAQHHGDRVQAEYYLQFADHYFRVIADNKARQDEARAKRDDDRGDNRQSADDGDDDGDNRRDNNRGRGRGRYDNRQAEDDGDDAGSNDGNNSGPNNSTDNRRGRAPRQSEGRQSEARQSDTRQADARASNTRRPVADSDMGEAAAKRPRGRPRKVSSDDASRKSNANSDGNSEIDASVLPPAISTDSANGADKPAAKKTPARKAPVRRRKVADDDSDLSATV